MGSGGNAKQSSPQSHMCRSGEGNVLGGRKRGREGGVCAAAVAGMSSGGGRGGGGLLSLMSNDGEPAANRNTEIISNNFK